MPEKKRAKHMGASLIAGMFLLVHVGITHALTGRPNQLNRDAELYHQLPEDSPARRALLESIEKRARRYEDRSWTNRLATSAKTYLVMNLVVVVGVAGFIALNALASSREQQARSDAIQRLQESFQEAEAQSSSAEEASRATQEALDAFIKDAKAGAVTNP